jgi:hypothetical protein
MPGLKRRRFRTIWLALSRLCFFLSKFQLPPHMRTFRHGDPLSYGAARHMTARRRSGD